MRLKHRKIPLFICKFFKIIIYGFSFFLLPIRNKDVKVNENDCKEVPKPTFLLAKAN